MAARTSGAQTRGDSFPTVQRAPWEDMGLDRRLTISFGTGDVNGNVQQICDFKCLVCALPALERFS
jgi:hypothetical protein